MEKAAYFKNSSGRAPPMPVTIPLPGQKQKGCSDKGSGFDGDGTAAAAAAVPLLSVLLLLNEDDGASVVMFQYPCGGLQQGSVSWKRYVSSLRKPMRSARIIQRTTRDEHVIKTVAI